MSALKRVGFSSHFCIFSFRLASVSWLSYPAFIIASISATFERTYSATLSTLKFTTQAAAERSAEASLSSNACSTFRLSSPSISKILPAKMFFLFFFSTLKSPFLIAKYGIALTRSRSVTPSFSSPLNLIKTDSGIFSGIMPSTAANATRPLPAGKLIPIGNLV